MDIANPLAAQRKRRRQLIALSTGAAAGPSVGLAIGTATLGPALPALERSSVWIDTVQRGDMLSEVRAPGTLVPRDIHWLAARRARR